MELILCFREQSGERKRVTSTFYNLLNNPKSLGKNIIPEKMAILDGISRNGLTEKVSFEYRADGSKWVNV